MPRREAAQRDGDDEKEHITPDEARGTHAVEADGTTVDEAETARLRDERG